MSCSPGIWGQFANFIRQKLPNKDRYHIIMDDIFLTWKTHKQDIEDLLDVLIQYGLRISPAQVSNVSRPACLHGLTFPD